MVVKKVKRLLLVSKVPLWLTTFITRLRLFPLSLIRRYPLYRKGCLEEQPLFILACGRSGNTLLRSMLTSTDQIAIPPESYVIPRVIRTFRANNYLPWEQLCSVIIGEFQSYKEFYTWKTDLAPALSKARVLPSKKHTLANIIDCIYQEYANQHGYQTHRWGDKTPINSLYARWIVKLFPDAYFIHLKRDPRAVAVSYRAARMYEDLESGLLLWKTTNQNIERVKPHYNFHDLTYEKLVSEPKQELEQVCNHCRLKYSDEMLEFYKKTGRLGDTVAHSHHANAGKQLTTKTISAWKDKVTQEELAMLNSNIKNLNS